MMRYLFLLIVSVFFAVPTLRAEHILGGEMTYEHVSGSRYRVILKVYKECAVGAALDYSVGFVFYRTDGTPLTTVLSNLEGPVEIPITSANPCMRTPPQVCIQLGRYVGEYTIPAGSGPVTVVWQRCCRGPGINNLNNGHIQGATYSVVIPDHDVHGPTNGPAFSAHPQVALCLDMENAVEHPITSTDGDSVVFSLMLPYIGGTNSNPVPTPLPPPYTDVTLRTGLTLDSLIVASRGLRIDPVTGTMTVQPTQQGRWVVGVRISVYRNGVLLTELYRDMLYFVAPCEALVEPIIADLTGLARCSGLEVQFGNNSIGTGEFFWDFGVPDIDSDTSREVAPSYPYPAPGFYEVTLVSMPGTTCADTTSMIYEVNTSRDVVFSLPDTLCNDGSLFSIRAMGAFSDTAVYTWDIGEAVYAGPADSVVLLTTFPGSGMHYFGVTVEDIGCVSSYNDSLVVVAAPRAGFFADVVQGCEPLSVMFTDTSTASLPLRYHWRFGDGGFSFEQHPQHTYTRSGAYSVQLVVSTTAPCVVNDTLTAIDLIQVFRVPEAQLAVDRSTVSILDPVVEFSVLTLDADQHLLSVENVETDRGLYQHIFKEAGNWPARLIVRTAEGCADTTTVVITVEDHLLFAPTAFSPNGDGINDLWRVQSKGARLYSLVVFDRWGHIVFETNDPAYAWDGANAPQGMYNYVIRLSEYGTYEKEYRGSFLLFR